MKIFAFLSLPLLASAQLRIDSGEFAVPEKEVRTILDATIASFPKAKLPPLFITRSEKGPITLHQRTPRKEIVIQLDVHQRYWAQYIYQFAHELAHVRADFKPGHHEQKWLEETLCETASLFALRQMSITWREHPPAPHLRDYRSQLYKYAQAIIASRETVELKDLSAFYKRHEAALRKTALLRPVNGSIAAALVPLFEVDPDRWHILATLNSFPKKKDMTLTEFFDAWAKVSPEEEFIPELKRRFLGS